MSINRLFLRTAAIAALSPEPEDAYPPTMAGRFVYDSRLDPATHHLEDGQHLPIIAIYTDDDESSPLTLSSASGMRKREVILRIQFAIASFDTIQEDGQTYRTIGYAAIDSELEARMDVFEQQIKWALLSTPWRAGTATFLGIVKSIGEIRSMPQRDEEGSNRVSSRALLLSCEIPDDCPPIVGIRGQEQKPKTPVFDDFPGAPWLSDMLNAMAMDKARHPVIDILGNSRTAAVYLPLLKRVGFKVDAIEPMADPDRLAKLGKTQGPDGRIEVEGILEINK